jgi:hypothetical protein
MLASVRCRRRSGSAARANRRTVVRVRPSWRAMPQGAAAPGRVGHGWPSGTGEPPRRPGRCAAAVITQSRSPRHQTLEPDQVTQRAPEPQLGRSRHEELRRRADILGIFSGRPAIVRLVGACFTKENDRLGQSPPLLVLAPPARSAALPPTAPPTRRKAVTPGPGGRGRRP